jgi:hypothetical protein
MRKNGNDKDLKTREKLLTVIFIPRRDNRAPTPMETPGFTWRVSLSILVFFAVAAFLIIWLLFYAGSLSAYQNVAVILVSIIAGIAILAASWASWGMKYGYKYRDEWGKKSYKQEMKECCSKGRVHGHGSGSAVYGLGFIGALIYFVTTAPTFWDAVIGFFKAIVWPAFLVYGSLKLLGI